jgi:hypothetical protein
VSCLTYGIDFWKVCIKMQSDGTLCTFAVPSASARPDIAMTKEDMSASFAPELLGGVPEAFVHTALLAGGVGLWEWPTGTDRMALSPYLETLLGYSLGEFDGTKSMFLSRLADRPAAFRGCTCRCD